MQTKQLSQRLRDQIQRLDEDGLLAVIREMAEGCENTGALWSTYHFAPSTTLTLTHQRLFSLGVGMSGQGTTRALSITDTNLREGGRIPGGLSYRVKAVFYEILGGSERDVQTLVDCGTLAFDFTQTIVDLAPLGAFRPLGTPQQPQRRGVLSCTPDTAQDREARIEGMGKTRGASSDGVVRIHAGGIDLPGNGLFSLSLRVGRGVGEREDVRIEQPCALRVTLLGGLSSIEIG